MALGSIQPLTEMITERPVRSTGNVSTLHADCLEILGTSTSWTPKGLSKPP